MSEDISDPDCLYHLAHKELSGEYLLPFLANNEDPQKYIYATSHFQECLPYAMPNGTRIANTQVPGSEEFLTILPDKDLFLKNISVQGTIYRFSPATFQKRSENSSQWVSEIPLHISRMEKIAQITSLDDVMRLGLHVFFINERAISSYDFLNEIVLDEGFPHNLLNCKKQNLLIYENEIRNIRPHKSFMPDHATHAFPGIDI